ncbi:auxin-responsive protein IAA26-like [Andrographis paniculata]|uniref:auxin-responsive protein IAA26-like n=1 Tax=Andrographis paniculata TaxID=175694 RepID=UPI0021E8A621|nr:auxin-responsive protein IAA26-like [Andrographis paniculata]
MEEEGCRQFLELLPNQDREWFVLKQQETTTARRRSHYLSEDKKLELSLGPPGGGPAMVMEEQSDEGEDGLQISDKKAFLPTKTAVPIPNAQKRTVSAQVVGWPPVRSFRKNFATSSSSRLASGYSTHSALQPLPDKVCEERQLQHCSKSRFVKINMDGIPIGRKVDLNAYDGYEKLFYAIDELFRDLLAAQSECSVDANVARKTSRGLLEESGEYTLVYEDNEGDRMLAGDVPWQMFVLTVKRLRVLRSCELPSLSRGSKHGCVPNMLE